MNLTAPSPNAPTVDKSVYDRDGYLCPVRVMPEGEMAEIRHRLESYLARAKRDPKDDLLLHFKVQKQVDRGRSLELTTGPAALRHKIVDCEDVDLV